jgi:hypothetical protein
MEFGLSLRHVGSERAEMCVDDDPHSALLCAALLVLRVGL